MTVIVFFARENLSGYAVRPRLEGGGVQVMTLTDFLSLFLPLFVAMDAFGALPSFLQMTEGLAPANRSRTLRLSVLTAGVVGLLFVPLGSMVMGALGLKTGDFQVAGGLLILVVALREIVWDEKMILKRSRGHAGVVPIGIPLLVGPAVLTTLLLLKTRFTDLEIMADLLVNLGLAWAVFQQANRVEGWMGETGSRVVAKLAALLLSAYAVMMIRVGFLSFR